MSAHGPDCFFLRHAGSAANGLRGLRPERRHLRRGGSHHRRPRGLAVEARTTTTPSRGGRSTARGWRFPAWSEPSRTLGYAGVSIVIVDAHAHDVIAVTPPRSPTLDTDTVAWAPGRTVAERGRARPGRPRISSRSDAGTGALTALAISYAKAWTCTWRPDQTVVQLLASPGAAVGSDAGLFVVGVGTGSVTKVASLDVAGGCSTSIGMDTGRAAGDLHDPRTSPTVHFRTHVVDVATGRGGHLRRRGSPTCPAAATGSSRSTTSSACASPTSTVVKCRRIRRARHRHVRGYHGGQRTHWSPDDSHGS